ncbi:MAG: hypothetical protein Q9165_007808 [Trypethelium subeluteriae]
MQTVPDLVRDSKLETRHTGGHTIHRYLEASSSRRRVLREEYWKRDKELGHGSFGRVWLEKCVKGSNEGQLRAVKMVPNFSNSSSAVDFRRESEAVAKFSNARYEACFAKSFGWYEDPEAIYIALEYCPHGDLRRYLSQTSSLSVGDAQELTRQILEGLHDMHVNGFAHRDLKPAVSTISPTYRKYMNLQNVLRQNILIKSQPPEAWWVKLTDFGISKRAGDQIGHSTVKGTLEFMAPEMLGFIPSASDSNARDPQLADMWALGEIAFRMLTGEHTFQNLGRLGEYCRGVNEFPSARLRSHAGDDAAGFVLALMAVDPNSRINTSDALLHSWMKLPSIDIQRDPPSDLLSVTQRLQLEAVNARGESQTVSIPEASARWSTIEATETVKAIPHFGDGELSARDPLPDKELIDRPKSAVFETTSDHHSQSADSVKLYPFGTGDNEGSDFSFNSGFGALPGSLEEARRLKLPRNTKTTDNNELRRDIDLTTYRASVQASENSIIEIEIFDSKRSKKKGKGFLGRAQLVIGSVLDLEFGGDEMATRDLKPNFNLSSTEVAGKLILNVAPHKPPDAK